jgi:hypothetical protein
VTGFHSTMEARLRQPRRSAHHHHGKHQGGETPDPQSNETDARAASGSCICMIVSALVLLMRDPIDLEEGRSNTRNRRDHAQSMAVPDAA